MNPKRGVVLILPVNLISRLSLCPISTCTHFSKIRSFSASLSISVTRSLDQVPREDEDSVRRIVFNFKSSGKWPRGRLNQHLAVTLHKDFKITGVHPNLVLDRER